MTTRGRQSGHLLQNFNSPLSKRVQCIIYLKFCFAGWHSWNCESVQTGRPLQDQAGLLQSLREDLQAQLLLPPHVYLNTFRVTSSVEQNMNQRHKNFEVTIPYFCSVQTAAPELMIEGRGFAERPKETPPASPGSVVPSPLQSSCRVCSCPGMKMDFAVLGGLQGEKKITLLSGCSR